MFYMCPNFYTCQGKQPEGQQIKVPGQTIFPASKLPFNFHQAFVCANFNEDLSMDKPTNMQVIGKIIIIKAAISIERALAPLPCSLVR